MGKSGLSLRAGGREFSPATKGVAPGYLYWKIEAKEIPSRLIPRLLVVFTRQLEILVTALVSGCTCIRRNLKKKTVLWGTIMWSEFGKQNLQAKNVH